MTEATPTLPLKTVTDTATSAAIAVPHAKATITLQDENVDQHATLIPVARTVAFAEATGSNPYIAVARATARAATIATAHAASNSTGSESDGDVSVTVSTSCKIQNDDKTKQESSDVIKTLIPQMQQQRQSLPPSYGLNIHVHDGDITEEKTLQSKSTAPRRIVITIEQPPIPAIRGGGLPGSPATQHRLACEIPSNDTLKTKIDVRRALSGPLMQALQDPDVDSLQQSIPRMDTSVAASQLSPSAMQEIIDSVTQQITEKYDIGKKQRAHVDNMSDNLLGTVTTSVNRDPIMSSNKSNVVKLLDPSPLGDSGSELDNKGKRYHRMKGSAAQNVDDHKKRSHYHRDVASGKHVALVKNTPNIPNNTNVTREMSGRVSPRLEESKPKGILKNKPPVMRPDIPVKRELLVKKYRHTRPVSDASDVISRRKPNLNGSLVEKYKQLISGPVPQAKKPYESVLLQPIEYQRTPLHILNELDAEASSRADKYKHDCNNEEFPYIKPRTPIKTDIDLAFEQRQMKFRKNKKISNPISSKQNLFLMNIEFENKRKTLQYDKRRSTEDLKNTINGIRLRAPTPIQIDKEWSDGTIRLSQSQENCLDAPINGYHYSPLRTSYTHCESDSRKSKSLSNVGSFFSNQKSYTSLYETDLDTWHTEQASLVHETDLDVAVHDKSRSLTNLSTGLQLTTVEIEPDFERRKSLETLKSNSLSYRVDIPITAEEKTTCLSANELQITESLKKLSVPEWYQSSQYKDQRIVELENTRKSMRSQERKEKAVEIKVSQDPKPVIIQHRVTVPLPSPRQISPNPNQSSKQFKLPSEKLKKSSVTLTTIETKKPLVNRDQPMRKSAKEKYLELKSSIDSGIRNKNVIEDHPGKFDLKPSITEETYTAKAKITLNKTPDASTTNSVHYDKHVVIPPIPPRDLSNEDIMPTKAPVKMNKSTLNQSPSVPQVSKSYVSTAYMDPPDATCNTKTYLNSGIHLESSQQVDSVYKTTSIMNGNLPNKFDNEMLIAEEKQKLAERQKHESQKDAGIMTSQEPLKYQYHLEHIQPHPDVIPQVEMQVKPIEHKTYTDRYSKTDQGKNNELPRNKGHQASSYHNQNLDAAIPSNLSFDDASCGLLSIPPPHMEHKGKQTTELPADTLISKLLGIIEEAEKIKSYMNTTLDETEPIMSYCETEIDQMGDQVVFVRCRNSKCNKSTEMKDARRTYKTCHNCYTYYCGRECRKLHWGLHKAKCLFSRVGSACKHFIRKVHDEEMLSESISRVAKAGFLTRGRGCVIVLFSSPEKTDLFMSGVSDINHLEHPPCYVTLEELENAAIFQDYREELDEQCRTYNPEIKYVFCTVIVAGDRRLIPTVPGPRRHGPVIQKSAKLRLALGCSRYPSPPHALKFKTSQNISEDPDTLILTALPGSELSENVDARKARELCLVNIQRKLRQRGVNLRLHYPDIHDRLCAFVSDNDPFKPITIYPIDVNSGKRFTCLIMPSSERDVDWMHNPDLLEELGIATEV